MRLRESIVHTPRAAQKKWKTHISGAGLGSPMNICTIGYVDALGLPGGRRHRRHRRHSPRVLLLSLSLHGFQVPGPSKTRHRISLGGEEHDRAGGEEGKGQQGLVGPLMEVTQLSVPWREFPASSPSFVFV